MLNREQIRCLTDDALCAIILFSVCALIVLVPTRSAESDRSATGSDMETATQNPSATDFESNR
jgi:hypothetical protein